MRPLFRELAMLVDELVQKGPVVGTESREQDLVVGGDEYVYIVELEESELMDSAADVGDGDAAGGSRTVKALSRKRDTAGFGEG